MMKIQKKSLEHASKVLKSFDTFPIYNAVSNALKEAEIPDVNKQLILKVLQEESYKLKQISEDAKNWIDAVTADLS